MIDGKVQQRLQGVESRFDELERMLCDPAVISDRAGFLKLSRERAEVEDVVGAFRRWKKVQADFSDNEAALADPELRDLATAEIAGLLAEAARMEEQIRVLLLPKDPNDTKNTILEIRSGTGGDEAALFAQDLLRMYSRFAERRGWTVESLSLSANQGGGVKEAICLVSGKEVFSHLRFEGGVHRVQRVPATESSGRIHTSAATVAVLPEAEDVEVQIEDKDLEITVAASGGPGGQGVNTTNSAVQIRHIPTGMIQKCQDERSQIKNKARAMKILKSRLLEREQQAQHDRISAERRGMVGTGDRSEKIRTYNFKDNRVTDHRIGLTLHQLDHVLDGDIDTIVNALRTHYEAERLRGA